MSNVIVLGAGMVGTAMAIDMAKKHEVTVSDFSQKALEKTKNKCSELSSLKLDVTRKEENADGHIEEVVYSLFDQYNTGTGTSSMARTTGYMATAAANMFLEGLFSEKGVFSPELVGKYKVCFDYFFNYLKERGICYIRPIK